MDTRRHRLPRPAIAFLHDVVMAALSFVIALALRRGETALTYLGDHTPQCARSQARSSDLDVHALTDLLLAGPIEIGSGHFARA